jgi:hypothetical protein
MLDFICVMITFIGTLNIPGMNIFRHNALRIRGVQERAV